MEQTIVVAGQPSRNRLSGQVILVLLLVTFPLMALLVLEQGRVIDAQKLLIRQLSSDSQQLNAMRVRELQNRGKQAAPPAQTPQADSQPQPGAQPQHGAAPDSKSRKRHESKQAPPAPSQEYPGTRQVPVRKSV
ncbi:MAG TPA: hypothetical protein VES66_02805 [Terriglobales bacterium]|nr:hypothetical protein [Terriglobales bacterium]